MPDGPPDSPAVAPGCELVPLGQVACYQFEDILGDGVFTDGSGNARHAVATGFSTVTRDVPAASQAIVPGVNASAKVAEATAFSSLVGDFTITAWIHPENPTTGTNANEGIVDHEGAWALSIFEGKLRCWSNRNSGLFVVETTQWINNAWQLVACEVTGNQGCIHRFDEDGTDVRVCATVSGQGSNGGNGISIGSFQDGGGGVVEQWSGALDDLRIYARALSETELCTLSGHTACVVQL